MIDLVWEDGHRVSVRNVSDRPVRVTLRGWLVFSEITLTPGERRVIDIAEIEQPVFAEFLA